MWHCANSYGNGYTPNILPFETQRGHLGGFRGSAIQSQSITLTWIIGHALVTGCHLCDVIPEDVRVFAPLHTASLKERVRNEGAGLVYCQRYRRALHAGRTAPIGRHSSPALIGHQTLELLRSDWLNLEPLALDNPAVK